MPPGQSKVESYAALRRDAREGMSNRALERKYRVGGRTVQKALSSEWPHLGNRTRLAVPSWIRSRR